MVSPQSDAAGSDETAALISRATSGDRSAAVELLERSLPSLRRWAHGRIPAGARGALDTCDLVQETALHTIARLDAFTPQHAEALRAYLRIALLNRIRDEARRLVRRPELVDLPEHVRCTRTTPLDYVLRADNRRRYRKGLAQLSPKNRGLVLARVERQWDVREIAQRFGFPTNDAARMAVTRALRQLMTIVHRLNARRTDEGTN